jgi:hypothetical protein
LLKIRTDVKWVADYRDPWVEQHIYPGIWPFSLIEPRLEQLTVGRSDLITTVSQPLSDVLAEKFPHVPVKTIENGFDPDDNHFGACELLPNDGKKRFIYTGTIYPGKSDISPFFEAIKHLEKSIPNLSDRCELVFAGGNLGDLGRLVQKYDMQNYVRSLGFVDRSVALSLQSAADALIFLSWEGPNTKGVLTGKLFEYLTASAPILGVGITNQSLAGNLIEQAGAGLALGTNVPEIAATIQRILEGNFSAPRNQELISTYSREVLARKMLEQMKRLVHP